MENPDPTELVLIKELYSMSLQITPKTKVGELLDRHPELEGLLISLSPAFEKLRNPVLRKTIARVATIQQIAVVGKVPLETIISTLRKSTGDNEQFKTINTDKMSNEKPAWLAKTISETLDAREMLARGEHPLQLVLAKTHDMESNTVFCLVTPFTPLPLIEKVQAQGLESYVDEISDKEVHSYFFKP
jgi:hypothetical protein